MTDKLHILLIEDSENEIEFFRDALEESELNFLFSTARNIQQAFTILNSIAADIIFINVHLAMKDNIFSVKKLRSLYPTPVAFYSNVKVRQIEKELYEHLNYVQLPGSTQAMGRILRNLLAGSETPIGSEEFADN
jgi:chemotaxis response regulator CheB